MTKVKLYGHLGERFGKEYEFDIITPQDAMHALRANFPDFMDYLLEHNEPGYWVFTGDENRSLEEMALPAGRKIIKIVPVVKGAKKSPVWTILIGVALVIVAGPLGALGAGALATAVVGIGVSLALQGISSLIAGSPATGPDDRGDNKTNKYFSGAVNTLQQGGPVFLVYGKVMAGSQVISAGIRTINIEEDDENCEGSMFESLVCTTIL